MSHYQWEVEKKTPDYFITNSVIGHWSTSRETRKFFTNIIATCTGNLPTTDERIEFWDSVAFYNYIQEFVGSAPRQAHSYGLWERSHPAFAEVMLRLKPQLVLVIGLLNWGNIDGLDGWYGRNLSLAPKPRYNQTWWYPLGHGNVALALHVKHMSSGYNFRDFAPMFAEAERAAIRGWRGTQPA
jgi:hypothetical protein